MQKRLAYLIKNGYVFKDDANKLENDIDNVMKLAKQLKNLVIKNLIKPLYRDTILEIYVEWYDTEIEFVKLLKTSVETQLSKD